MTKNLEFINSVLWGAPAMVLILGVGIYLTGKLGLLQLTLFPKAIRLFFSRLRPGKRGDNGSSSLQALCTALAATVGTGNLAGVAGAICLGGPGAIFWMWISALLGMVIKYAEATLAVRCRIRTDDGFLGGPMYMMAGKTGRFWKWLAVAYSLFGLIASFGVGNAAQINAVITGINAAMTSYGGRPSVFGNLTMGIVLAILIGTLLLGGAKQIGAAAESLVPLAAVVYIGMCAGVLLAKADAIAPAVGAIVQGAVSPRAVSGGMLGSAYQTMRIGCARGVFTNEAGMGTAAIAHAAADVSHPAEQGLMGLLEVFLDTIVICTLTALVILVSGVEIPYGADAGVELTTAAFASLYGEAASLVMAVSLSLFAVAAILGWGLYGARCAQFLFGPKAWKYFVFAQTAAVVFGSVLDTAAVWQFSEMFNGLMVIPNLITLAAFSPELVRLTKEYRKSGRKTAGGGNYADFHQCKPL